MGYGLFDRLQTFTADQQEEFAAVLSTGFGNFADAALLKDGSVEKIAAAVILGSNIKMTDKTARFLLDVTNPGLSDEMVASIPEKSDLRITDLMNNIAQKFRDLLAENSDILSSSDDPVTVITDLAGLATAKTIADVESKKDRVAIFDAFTDVVGLKPVDALSGIPESLRLDQRFAAMLGSLEAKRGAAKGGVEGLTDLSQKAKLAIINNIAALDISDITGKGGLKAGMSEAILRANAGVNKGLAGVWNNIKKVLRNKSARAGLLALVNAYAAVLTGGTALAVIAVFSAIAFIPQLITDIKGTKPETKEQAEIRRKKEEAAGKAGEIMKSMEKTMGGKAGSIITAVSSIAMYFHYLGAWGLLLGAGVGTISALHTKLELSKRLSADAEIALLDRVDKDLAGGLTAMTPEAKAGFDRYSAAGDMLENYMGMYERVRVSGAERVGLIRKVSASGIIRSGMPLEVKLGILTAMGAVTESQQELLSAISARSSGRILRRAASQMIEGRLEASASTVIEDSILEWADTAGAREALIAIGTLVPEVAVDIAKLPVSIREHVSLTVLNIVLDRKVDGRAVTAEDILASAAKVQIGLERMPPDMESILTDIASRIYGNIAGRMTASLDAVSVMEIATIGNFVQTGLIDHLPEDAQVEARLRVAGAVIDVLSGMATDAPARTLAVLAEVVNAILFNAVEYNKLSSELKKQYAALYLRAANIRNEVMITLGNITSADDLTVLDEEIADVSMRADYAKALLDMASKYEDNSDVYGFILEKAQSEIISADEYLRGPPAADKYNEKEITALEKNIYSIASDIMKARMTAVFPAIGINGIIAMVENFEMTPGAKLIYQNIASDLYNKALDMVAVRVEQDPDHAASVYDTMIDQVKSNFVQIVSAGNLAAREKSEKLIVRLYDVRINSYIMSGDVSGAIAFAVSEKAWYRTYQDMPAGVRVNAEIPLAHGLIKAADGLREVYDMASADMLYEAALGQIIEPFYTSLLSDMAGRNITEKDAKLLDDASGLMLDAVKGKSALLIATGRAMEVAGFISDMASRGYVRMMPGLIKYTGTLVTDNMHKLSSAAIDSLRETELDIAEFAYLASMEESEKAALKGLTDPVVGRAQVDAIGKELVDVYRKAIEYAAADSPEILGTVLARVRDFTTLANVGEGLVIQMSRMMLKTAEPYASSDNISMQNIAANIYTETGLIYQGAYNELRADPAYAGNVGKLAGSALAGAFVDYVVTRLYALYADGTAYDISEFKKKANVFIENYPELSGKFMVKFMATAKNRVESDGEFIMATRTIMESMLDNKVVTSMQDRIVNRGIDIARQELSSLYRTQEMAAMYMFSEERLVNLLKPEGPYKDRPDIRAEEAEKALKAYEKDRPAKLKDISFIICASEINPDPRMRNIFSNAVRAYVNYLISSSEDPELAADMIELYANDVVRAAGINSPFVPLMADTLSNIALKTRDSIMKVALNEASGEIKARLAAGPASRRIKQINGIFFGCEIGSEPTLNDMIRAISGKYDITTEEAQALFDAADNAPAGFDKLQMAIASAINGRRDALILDKDIRARLISILPKLYVEAYTFEQGAITAAQAYAILGDCFRRQMSDEELFAMTWISESSRFKGFNEKAVRIIALRGLENKYNEFKLARMREVASPELTFEEQLADLLSRESAARIPERMPEVMQPPAATAMLSPSVAAALGIPTELLEVLVYMVTEYVNLAIGKDMYREEVENRLNTIFNENMGSVERMNALIRILEIGGMFDAPLVTVFDAREFGGDAIVNGEVIGQMVDQVVETKQSVDARSIIRPVIVVSSRSRGEVETAINAASAGKNVREGDIHVVEMASDAENVVNFAIGAVEKVESRVDRAQVAIAVRSSDIDSIEKYYSSLSSQDIAGMANILIVNTLAEGMAENRNTMPAMNLMSILVRLASKRPTLLAIGCENMDEIKGLEENLKSLLGRILNYIKITAGNLGREIEIFLNTLDKTSVSL